jgi:biopolymer transport protein ExbB/TolQ
VNLPTMLENGLFALGQVLRVPVMVLLWVCVAAALFMAARTISEAVSRRRERQAFSIEGWLRASPVLGASEERHVLLPVELRVLMQQYGRMESTGSSGAADLDNLVVREDERLRASLAGPRLLVKVGPSLGLLGTLIPMGTALAAMAGGNLEAMAGQMVVAFTTTIVGIASGTIAFVVLSVRQKWVAESSREQRYLAERVSAELQKHGRDAG